MNHLVKLFKCVIFTALGVVLAHMTNNKTFMPH